MKLRRNNKWIIRTGALMLMVLAFYSCNQEEEVINPTLALKQKTKIVEAKKWFESYKDKTTFAPLFTDLNYHWELAVEITLEDSSKAITVPLTQKHPNPKYTGEEMLFLYPTAKGYDALVQELIPENHSVTKKEILENLETFTGYILIWDLKEGFVKGAKFENSIAVNTLSIKSDAKPDNITGKEVPIPLDEVIIQGGGGSTSGAPRDFSIGGSFDAGSISAGSYYGGGGSSATSTSNSAVNAPPSCQSFNFQNKTGSLWQESAVKNIHFNIVVISPKGYEFIQIINYPNAILFGVPTNIQIGNTDISSGLAATLSAKAIDVSMSETVKMYGNQPVTELTVRLYFEERLKHNYPLFIPGGRVNFNAATFSGTPTNYITNMFGTGNCN